MITFSNPTVHLEITDYPLGGSKRGRCIFTVKYHHKKGYKPSRVTIDNGKESKPKETIAFGGPVAFVTGSNGRTYILQFSRFGAVSIWRADMMCATNEELGVEGGTGAHYVSDNKPEYAALIDLIKAATPGPVVV